MSTKISRRKFLKSTLAAGAGLTVGSAVWAKSGITVDQPFDTIIKNGTVYTGEAGKAGFLSDVGIKGERIAAIGQLGDYAHRLVDAKGLAVSPGFIDIHSHTDTNLLVCPAGDSRIYQGVTTEIGGNCGDSPFPGKPYPSIEIFFDALRSNKIGINYGSFTGQGQLRSAVVGDRAVTATSEQIEKMKAVLEHQMENGSMGISFGLEYAPGAYASYDELVAMLKVVAKYNGLFAIHMRNEDDFVEEAMAEAIRMARDAGVRLEISHLKAQNFANWHKGPAMIKRIEEAASRGMDIAFDRYPYTAFSTGLTSFIPLQDRQGSTEAVMARLQDKQKAAEIGKYALGRFERLGGPGNIVVSSVSLEHNKVYMGKNLAECASMNHTSEWDFVRDLLIEERLYPDIVAFAMNEENVKLFLSHPLGIVISDGSVYSPVGPLSKNMPHPRCYGTFPRFLGKYCRQEKIVDLPAAIHKITAQPASRVGLKERGLLLPNYFADLVVFNPDTIIDRADYIHPHRFPEGISHVWVNGAHTIRDGKHTGALSGQIIV